MKKILLIIAAMAIAASADVYKMGGVQIGIGSSSIGPSSNNGIYSGMDGFLPLNNGLAIGWGLDVLALDNIINDQAGPFKYLGSSIKLLSHHLFLS